MYNKTVFLILSFILLTSPVFAERIVAIVNDDIVTESELEGFIQFTELELSSRYEGKGLEEQMALVRKDALNTIIENKLILQQAKKEGAQVTKRALDKRVEEIKKRYPSEELFRVYLIQRGLTQSDIEERITAQMLIKGFMEMKFESNVHVSPAEITRYYKEHGDEIKKPQMRKVSALAIKDKDALYGALNRLKTGGGFKEAADGEMASFIDMGIVSEKTLRKEFDELVFRPASPGITDHIEVDGVYYVFKIDEIMPEERLALDEAQPQIKAIISYNKVTNKIKSWLKEVKERSYIAIK